MRYEISKLLSDISMGPFGSNIKTDCYTEYGVPYLNGSNLTGYKLNETKFKYVSEEKADSLGRCVAHRGDIIVTHRGTLGQMSFIPENSKFKRYVTGNSQFRFTCNKEIVLPEYLVYYFHSPIGQHKLLSNASQVGVPSLARPTSSFQKLEIDIPPIEEQKKIVAIISELEDKIELNTTINENLEQQAQALFKAWFVDFEPFDGVMPEDWRTGLLSELAEINSGKRPPMRQTSRTEDINIPLVGAASIMGYTNEANHNDRILVIGRVGTHGIVQRFSTPCWTSDNTLVITTPYYEYINQILRQIDYKAMNRGSTQPLITQGDMNKAEILIPSETYLKKFEELVGTLMIQYEINRIENEHISALRDALLPKLMNGEIDVSAVKV